MRINTNVSKEEYKKECRRLSRFFQMRDTDEDMMPFHLEGHEYVESGAVTAQRFAEDILDAG